MTCHIQSFRFMMGVQRGLQLSACQRSRPSFRKRWLPVSTTALPTVTDTAIPTNPDNNIQFLQMDLFISDSGFFRIFCYWFVNVHRELIRIIHHSNPIITLLNFHFSNFENPCKISGFNSNSTSVFSQLYSISLHYLLTY